MQCTCDQITKSLLSANTLVLRCRGSGRRKSAWYTLFAPALNCHGTLWGSCSYVYVRMYSGDVINSLCWCASWHSHSVLFECVLFYAVWCLPVAGCLEIKFKKEQVASNECVYQWNIPVCSYPQISAIQLLPLPTRHFLFVPNRIKLGKSM